MCLSQLLSSTDINIVAVDIGARGGEDKSLKGIKDIVNWFLIEPDPEEAQRLRALYRNDRSKVSIIEAAVGIPGQFRTLNLYSQRGCSSLLEAKKTWAGRYERGHYYNLEGHVTIKPQSLDDLAEASGFNNAAYLKIDIQGAELEAFQTASNLLKSLLMIRCEVSFNPQYEGQPLFSDIDNHLRSFGFEIFRFPKLNHWRRGSRIKEVE